MRTEFEEIKQYCHIIRDGIIWVAEALVYERQYVGRQVPQEVIDEQRNELDWKKFEKLYCAKHQAFVALEVFGGLNNDFLHFTNHSLKSLHPASMAVSYTLARKPYRDSLAYLEYLYARPADFLEVFISRGKPGQTKKLDKMLSENERKLTKELMIESCKKLRDRGSVNIMASKSDFLYEFRYGVEYTGFFDQAIHLITSRSYNATDDVNMNFIFLNNDAGEAEKHAAHLLRIHLNNLSYGLEIMVDLLFILLKEYYDDEVKRFDEYYKYLQFRRITANISMAYGHRLLNDATLDKKYILALMRALKHIVKYQCSACGSKRFLDDSLKSAEVLIFDEVVLCRSCKYPTGIEKPQRLTAE